MGFISGMDTQFQSYCSIALPSGRLSRESIEFLNGIGYAKIDIPDTRELSFFDSQKKIRILLLRNQDVPLTVLYGGADIGICGKDILYEHGYDLIRPFALPFGFCRLSLAIPEQMNKEELYRKAHIRIATKYPNLTKKFFFNKGINVEVIKLHGSIEVAPLLEIADCIVDLVSTGRTLKENHLKEIEVLLESSAMLIVNRAAYYVKNPIILDLIQVIKKSLTIRA